MTDAIETKLNTGLIKSYVDYLFRTYPPIRGGQSLNKITGGWYIGFEDPIGPQKRQAHRALLAREWFAIYGPKDAPPLPLSDLEMEELTFTDPFSHIVQCFAHSLRSRNWNFNIHPSFDDFARGCTASSHAPDLIKTAEALRKRYPPCLLHDLGPGLCWEPPKEHAETMASYRRSRAPYK